MKSLVFLLAISVASISYGRDVETNPDLLTGDPWITIHIDSDVHNINWLLRTDHYYVLVGSTFYLPIEHTSFVLKDYLAHPPRTSQEYPDLTVHNLTQEITGGSTEITLSFDEGYQNDGWKQDFRYSGNFPDRFVTLVPTWHLPEPSSLSLLFAAIVFFIRRK